MRFTGIVVAVLAFASVAWSQAADLPKAADGSLVLFNGKDLSGWEGNPKYWSVKDGAITGQTTKENPTKGNTFLIWKAGTVKDFEMKLKFRMEGGNSGIQYRSKDVGNWVVGGYQADIDATNTYTGILYEERGRGILATVGQKVTIGTNGKPQLTGKVADPAEVKASIKNGEWNDYVIRAEGNHIVHMVNGRTTVDVTDNDEKGRAMEGIVALQVHAGPPMLVQFKDLTLKVIEK